MYGKQLELNLITFEEITNHSDGQKSTECMKLPMHCKSTVYLAHGCSTFLNSVQHCNMWVLALVKAWQAAWMAVPATPLDSDVLERRPFWSTNSTKWSTAKNTSQDQELEDSQKRYKPSDLWASAVLYINHDVNRIRRITLPSKMLGALWSFDESVFGEKGFLWTDLVRWLCLSARKPHIVLAWNTPLPIILVVIVLFL